MINKKSFISGVLTASLMAGLFVINPISPVYADETTVSESVYGNEDIQVIDEIEPVNVTTGSAIVVEPVIEEESTPTTEEITPAVESEEVTTGESVSGDEQATEESTLTDTEIQEPVIEEEPATTTEESTPTVENEEVATDEVISGDEQPTEDTSTVSEPAVTITLPDEIQPEVIEPLTTTTGSAIVLDEVYGVTETPIVIEFTDRVYNKVTDEGILGVEITAINKATSDEFSTTTDDKGYFTLNLPVGEYEFTLVRKGFITINTDVIIEDKNKVQGE